MKPKKRYSEKDLETSPPEEWIKENPFIPQVFYIPIDKTEKLLSQIYEEWRVEVLEVGQLFSAVFCKVRLHYLKKKKKDDDSIARYYDYTDGVGAVEVNISPKKNTMQQDSVTTALPIAKTLAIRNATYHLGKIFGRDMNREDNMETMVNKKEQSYKKSGHDQCETVREEVEKDLHSLYFLKQRSLTSQEQSVCERILNEKEENSYKKLREFLMGK